MPVLPAPSIDARFGLPAGAVHVWHLDLVAAAETRGLADLIDAQEWFRSQGLRDADDRRQFIAAHAAQRILLGCYLGCAPETVRLEYGSNGKPRGCGIEGAPDIRFNASRTRGRTVFAFALGKDVGVDVEEISDRLDPLDVAGHALSRDEAQFLRARPAAAQRNAFFSLWVRKEAFLKACGTGLAIPPSHVETAGDGAVRIKGKRQRGWRVQDVVLATGYAAAICSEGDQSHDVVVREMNGLPAQSDQGPQMPQVSIRDGAAGEPKRDIRNIALGGAACFL
jgi:4'-phosphopantetheinyl transferase